MNKKFILHVIPSFYPAVKFGGPNINLHKMSLAMSKYQTIKVFTTDKSLSNKFKNKEISYNKNYKAYYFKIFNNANSKFYFSLSFIFAYLKILRKNYVIHLHTLFQFPCLFILFINLFIRKDLIISFRGTFTPETLNKNIYRKIYKNFIIFIFKLIKPKFIFSSKIEYLDFRKICHLKYFAYKIIPNGIDLEKPIFFKKKYDIKRISLIYFGRLDKKKNIHKIVDNIKDSKNIYLDLYVFINDSMYFESLKKSINDKKLNRRINFKSPFLNINNLKKTIQNYDFSVFLSDKENFCNSALESLYLGLPTIMNKNIGLSYYLRENEQYVNIENINNLATILNTYNTKKINNLKNSVLNKLSTFHFNHISKKHFEFYDITKK